MNQNTDNRNQQELETPDPDGLKAERIQEALAAAGADGESRLKAERIQIALRDLPGWRLQRGARQIARTFELPDAHQVARLLRYVADLGDSGGTMPDVTVRGGEVTFALPTVASGVYLMEPAFELAKALEIRS